ncbi:MAG: hypothetical protein EOO46_22630, partial [Flavobacterium sp.]
MRQFRKFNHELKGVNLDEKYALAFSMFDGFSHRLLAAQLTIDWNCYYFLEMESFENRCKEVRLYTEEGALPRDVLNFFERLMESEYVSLKRSYQPEHLSIDDVGRQQFLLNFDSQTICIEIMDGLPKEYFQSET